MKYPHPLAGLTRPMRVAFWCGLLGITIGALGIRLAESTGWVRLFDNLHWTSSTAAAAALAWLGWRRARREARPGPQGWFALAFGGYALGQLAWDWQTWVGYAAFPSPSDLFYLWLGPGVALGLLHEVRAARHIDLKAMAMDTGALVIAALTLVLALYLPLRGELDVLSIVVLVAYPATLLAVTAILLMMIPAMRLRPTPSLLLFLPGMAVTAWSWMTWNLMALEGTAIDGAWFNISFSVAVLAAGVAAAEWRLDRTDDPHWDRLCESFMRQLPLLAVVAASGAMIGVHYHEDAPELTRGLTFVGAMLVIALAALRQGELLRDRDRLLEAQEEVRRGEQALVQERGFLRGLLATVPDLIWMKDPEGVYLFCNPTFERLYGAPEAAIVGRTDYDFVAKDLADFFREHDRAAAAAGRPAVNEEWLTFAADGYRGRFETVKTPMFAADGRLVGVLGVARDISTRHAAEGEVLRYRDRLEELVKVRTAQLEQAKDAAETANRAKSAFLANMSHELRTPLNAILGFSQIMVREGGLDDGHARAWQTIHHAGQHLLHLINDVLDLSRIEAGRRTIELTPFNLPAALDAVEEIIRPRAEAKGLELVVERGPDLPRHVVGDAGHLRQVLINLLGNAAKYTERGRITLRVTADEGGEGVRFAVADTGPGIAPEEQEKVFQAFYQTAVGIAKGEGTGLGLVISRELVRLMGGELGLESAPGQGSCFGFTLPLPVTSPPAQTMPVGRVIGLAPGEPAWRILIAEDEAVNREVLRRLLRGVGLEVREAEDGRQAVALFQEWRPHLIWMDMRMPVMDGMEASRAIRGLPGGSEVRIVALTASVFQEERAAILEAGCDDVAIKPFEIERLFDILHRLLGVRFLQAEAESGAAPGAADLAALPAGPRERLRAAAELLDADEIAAILDEIRPTHPQIAAAVKALAEEFNFDRLAALCRSGADAEGLGDKRGV